MKLTKRQIIWISIGSLLFILTPLWIYMWHLAENGISEQPEHWGQFGDFIGGILNPFISLLTLVATIVIAVIIKRIDDRNSDKSISASFQPQLEIESFEFFTYISKETSIRKPVEFSRSAKGWEFLSELKTANKFSVNLVNLGLGPAKNVEIVFEIPTDEIIDLLNSKPAPQGVGFGLQRQMSPDNGLINYGIQGIRHPRSISVNPTFLRKSIPYILNVNISRDPIILWLPEALLELYTMYQYYWGLIDPDKRDSFPKFPPVIVRVKYNDIGTKTFEKKITMNLQSIYESYNEFASEFIANTTSIIVTDSSQEKSRKSRLTNDVKTNTV